MSCPPGHSCQSQCTGQNMLGSGSQNLIISDNHTTLVCFVQCGKPSVKTKNHKLILFNLGKRQYFESLSRRMIVNNGTFQDTSPTPSWLKIKPLSEKKVPNTIEPASDWLIVRKHRALDSYAKLRTLYC